MGLLFFFVYFFACLFFFLPQVCYAKELKEGFVEYTEQVVKLMVPLLKFYFHDDILLLQTLTLDVLVHSTTGGKNWQAFSV